MNIEFSDTYIIRLTNMIFVSNNELNIIGVVC
jgi:hypothetical protein